MIQDIEPHVFDNAFSDRSPDDGSRVLIYRGNKALVGDSGDFMTYREFRDRGIDLPLRYLFSVDGDAYYLCEGDPPEGSGFSFLDNGAFRSMEPQERGFAGITGASLARWYSARRFCGCCGTRLVPSDRERAMVCPQCGITEYPRISPAVIVGITDADRLLLTRYRVGYRRWALVAGYCEVGESVEATVRREVAEEVGLSLRNLRYWGSQPWPFSDSLLMGFFADLDGPDRITLQQNELSEARWFKRDELPVQESLASLTSNLIEAFRCGEERR